MKLEDYLKKNNLTHDDFSRKVGVTRPLITQIIGGRNPSTALVKRIEEITNGEVTLNDLFNPEAPSRLKKKEIAKSKT